MLLFRDFRSDGGDARPVVAQPNLRVEDLPFFLTRCSTPFRSWKFHGDRVKTRGSVLWCPSLRCHCRLTSVSQQRGQVPVRTGHHAQRRRSERVPQLSQLRRDAEAVSRGSACDFGATESTACCHVAAHSQDNLAEVNNCRGRYSQLLRGVGLHRRTARRHQLREWQPHPDTWFRKGSSVDSARARCFSKGCHAGGLEHMELRCLCWARPLLNSQRHECFSSETSEVTAEPPVLSLHSQSEGRGARWTSCATSTPRTSSATLAAESNTISNVAMLTQPLEDDLATVHECRNGPRESVR